MIDWDAHILELGFSMRVQTEEQTVYRSGDEILILDGGQLVIPDEKTSQSTKFALANIAERLNEDIQFVNIFDNPANENKILVLPTDLPDLDAFMMILRFLNMQIRDISDKGNRLWILIEYHEKEFIANYNTITNEIVIISDELTHDFVNIFIRMPRFIIRFSNSELMFGKTAEGEELETFH